MAHLPMIKLAGLLVRQVARPVVRVLQDRLKKNKTFANTLTTMANAYQNLETRTRRRILGLQPGSASARSMDPNQALELVVDLIGESLIIFAAGTVVYIDWSRNKAKEDRNKEFAAAQDAKMGILEAHVEELQGQVVGMQAMLASLQRDLGGKVTLPSFMQAAAAAQQQKDQAEKEASWEVAAPSPEAKPWYKFW